MNPPVRLVPGLGLDASAWQPTLAALPTAVREGAQVLELPGFGRRHQGGGLEPPTMAVLVERHLEEHVAARPTVLVGHSASCHLLAHAAARRPDLVAGLVLVGPTTDPRAASWPRLAGRWLATVRHERLGQVPSLLRQYAGTGPRAMYLVMAAARRDDVRVPLRRARCPVLIVRGKHDRICVSDWAEALAAADSGGTVPPARAVTLPTGAHMVPLTHGRLVAALLTEFVSDLPA
ncbi:MAG: alpha/beta fold hydrolase [Nocardioides sp.]